ncbi:MAG: flagellar biosynthetic protein FliO [Phycisphaerales bacterium]|nr:MAG: flagellar biosynthetic protein FliO [Phycisphaerales bacterium]
MRNVNSLRNGGCGLVVGWLSAGGVMAIGVIAAFLALPARGSDGDTPGDPASLRVGPNQGVTLTPQAPLPGSDVDEELDASPQVDFAGQDVPEPEVSEVLPPVGTRMLKRRGSTSDARGGSQEDSPPWHRTGIGALMIVLGIVGGLYYAVRRFVPSTRAADNGIVRVVGRTPLTPKHHVALVQLGRRYVAVGVSGDRIERLCEIDDSEEVAELAARVGMREVRGGNGFDELLFRETTEYRDPSDERAEDARKHLDIVTARNRGPLKDLIRRLKKLNAK